MKKATRDKKMRARWLNPNRDEWYKAVMKHIHATRRWRWRNNRLTQQILSLEKAYVYKKGEQK